MSVRFKALLLSLTLICGVLAIALPAMAVDGPPRSGPPGMGGGPDDLLPLTGFYNPPAPLPRASAGALIRSEAFDGYVLPKGGHAVRILYHSQTVHGRDVAASGVVLIPAGAAPRGGWPVVAWAHGTSGVARQSAPSLMKSVYYGENGLMPMVAAGFAVVAADYAGLGTPGPHQYDDKIAQANDVLYSIPAARAAVPALGRRWAAIGHSQGGVAVWGVAELEFKLRDPDYVGAISVAGDMDYDRMYQTAMARGPQVSLWWPMVAYGISASYPSLDVAKMLTPVGMSVFPDLTTKGGSAFAAALKTVGDQPTIRPDWRKLPEVQNYIRDSLSANKPIQGPLLVLAGDDDHSVALANIADSVARACKLGLPIEYIHRPGLDHIPLFAETIGEQLDWVRDRLAAKPWVGNCTK
jgi:alpha-beta hydrolase superfamily lysophospholipase